MLEKEEVNKFKYVLKAPMCYKKIQTTLNDLNSINYIKQPLSDHNRCNRPLHKIL